MQPEQPPAGRLGVQVVELSPDLVRRLGLRADVEGVIVAGVLPGGAAAEAGIRPADIIVRIDGKAVKSPEDLQAALANATPEQQLSVVVRRGNVQILMQTRIH
jgi:serine protease DegQ